jgi:hypothetical protein
MSAEIIRLADFRANPADEAECDIVTAVDVAIRDLREILTYWGSAGARARAVECEQMLTRAYQNGVIKPPTS